MLCCLCEQVFVGHGNNPHQMEATGDCCDSCNSLRVIPARLLVVSLRIKDRDTQLRVISEYMKAPDDETRAGILLRYRFPSADENPR